MNRFKRAAIPLAILALVGLTGCDDSSDPASTLGAPDGLQPDELYVLGLEDAVTAAGEPTLTGAMGFPGDFPDGRHHGHGPHAGPPLRALDLDPEQQEMIMAAYRSYRECMREPLDAFRDANQEILRRAEQARQEILEELRNEVIERDEAMLRLRELMRATLDAIRNSEAAAVLRAAICECRDEFFDAIRSVLDDEQQEMWNRWVSGHAGDCAQG